MEAKSKASYDKNIFQRTIYPDILWSKICKIESHKKVVNEISLTGLLSNIAAVKE